MKITLFNYSQQEGRKTNGFWLELFIWLRSFVHHVVGNAKLDAQEKLFVLTTLSGFIELCRVSVM